MGGTDRGLGSSSLSTVSGKRLGDFARHLNGGIESRGDRALGLLEEEGWRRWSPPECLMFIDLLGKVLVLGKSLPWTTLLHTDKFHFES